MKLQEQPGVTLYYQIKSILKEQILSGKLSAGDKVDNELDIAQKYEVSRATVRKAISELVQEGIMTRKRGKGTFVMANKFDTTINLQFSYPSEFGSYHKTLLQKVLELDNETARKVGLAFGDSIYQLTRLRYFDQDPVAIESIFFPLHVFPQIDQCHIEGRAFDFIYEKYKIKIEHFTTEIEPVILSAEETRLFELKERRSAGLVITRICRNEMGRTLLWHQSLFRGDRCRFLFK